MHFEIAVEMVYFQLNLCLVESKHATATPASSLGREYGREDGQVKRYGSIKLKLEEKYYFGRFYIQPRDHIHRRINLRPMAAFMERHNGK